MRITENEADMALACVAVLNEFAPRASSTPQWIADDKVYKLQQKIASLRTIRNAYVSSISISREQYNDGLDAINWVKRNPLEIALTELQAIPAG